MRSDTAGKLRGMSLSTKLLLVVFIPVCCQFVLIGGISYLEYQAELEAERASKAKRLTEIINNLGYTLAEVASTSTSTSDGEDTISDISSFRKTIKKVQGLDGQFLELKRLTKNDDEKQRIVLKSEAACKQAKRTFRELLSLGVSDVSPERKSMWKQLRLTIKEMISPSLLALGKSEERVVNESPLLQAKLRNQLRTWLAIAGGINLVFAIVISVFLVRNLRGRLQVLTSNINLFGAGQRLNPRVAGSDEIALFDGAFHEMAAQMTEASRKERAIVDNAIDMICSLDSSLRFLSVNPAAESFLNLPADEILGRRLVEFLPAAQINVASEQLLSLEREKHIDDLEIKLVRRDGSEIHTSWSMRFSAGEQSIFCVVHNITERKRAEELRQELLAMITHDMCTPLTSISNSLELIAMGRCGELDETGKNYLDIAARNAARINTLADDLLSLEKARSGMMQLSTEALKLQEAFTKCSELLEPLAAKNEMSLIVEETDLVVSADPAQLQRLLTNLVGNAIKYAGNGTKVVLSARKIEGFAEISVRDNGAGIPEEQRERIFERFYQTSAQHSGLGSGLGLSICKTLVELHGGTIALKSEQGEGTEFVLTLLLA